MGESRHDGSWVLNDLLTLLDDSSTAGPFFAVYDPHNGYRHTVDEGDYRLLEFLAAPRTSAELEAFYAELPGRLSSPDKVECSLEEYLARFRQRRLVVEAAQANGRGRDRAPILFSGRMVEAPRRRRAHCSPSTIAVCPTNRCNLACRHCSQSTIPPRTEARELSVAELADCFDQLEAIGLHDMRITGGEPLVRPDIFEVLEEAARRRFALYLFTNGTLLDEEKVRRIRTVKERKRGNFLVHLSLDGGTAEAHEWLRRIPGSFEGLARGMALLREQGIPFYCEFVLNRRNIGTLEEAVRHLIAHGAGSISIHTASSAGRAAHRAELLLNLDEAREAKRVVNDLRRRYRGRLGIRFNSYNWPLESLGEEYLDPNDPHEKEVLKKPGSGPTGNPFDSRLQRRCNAGISQMTIGADGLVYPCPNCFGVEEFAAGSVREGALLDIWRSGRWGFFRDLWMVEEMLVCRSCPWLEICGLGLLCRPVVYQAYGDLLGPPPACIVAWRDLGLDRDVLLAYLSDLPRRVPARHHAYIASLRSLVEEGGGGRVNAGVEQGEVREAAAGTSEGALRGAVPFLQERPEECEA